MSKLPPLAKFAILCTILVGAALLAWNYARLEITNLLMLLVLSALATLSLILKVEGATERLHYNITFLVFAFAFVLIGPLETTLVVLISNLAEWAWHRKPWYIQSFNLATDIVTLHVTTQVYHKLNPEHSLYHFTGILSILVALAVFTLINHLMVGGVIWLAHGENFARSGVFDFLPLMIDFTTLCMGASTALVWMVNPYAVILALVPLYLIYNTLKVPALERQSETDPKTGLYNARFFERALQNELNRADRFDRPMTVVMADLDLLRNINNTYGHLAGDEVLIGVAKIFKQYTRDYDIVARFGGEEFSILVPEATPQEVYGRIDTIREMIERAEFTVPTIVTPIKATMSFGIAGRQGFNQSASDIVHNADAALYHAKLKGRNCTFIYSTEIFDSVFQDGQGGAEAPESVSLQDRVQATDLPYRPSALREPAQPSKPPVQVERASETEAVHYPEAQAPIPAAMPAPSWVVNLFIATIACAALSLFSLTFKPLRTYDWIGLVIFGLVVILTEWMAIDITVRGTSLSTSAAAMLAGTLLFGPLGALILSISFAVAATIKRHSKINRLVFNAGNQMLAGLLYTNLILLVGKPFTDLPALGQVILSLFSAGIVYLSTTSLMAIAIHLDAGFPIKDAWKEHFSWLTPYYLTMGLIASALSFGFQFNREMGVAVILIPLLLFRLSQKRYVDRTKATANELRENNLMLKKYALEINEQFEALLDILAVVIELRDPTILGHSRQVSRFSALIAQRLGLPEKQIEFIRQAALLHDIGRLSIPDTILMKPGALNNAEYQTIKGHALQGADILQPAYALRHLIPIVRHHHERYDGRGYPDHLKGQKIPLAARIVAVADAVEAMASDRPYRNALNFNEIVEQVRNNSGSQFDPNVANAFLEIMLMEGETLIVNPARKGVVKRIGQAG